MSLKRPLDNIVDALRYAAANTTEGIVVYQPQPNGQDSVPVTMTYKTLLEKAERNASILNKFQLAKPNTIILLHFDGILDTIEWYWAVLLFGATPSVTGPGMFNSSPSDQQKHLKHLRYTLEAPVCLTRRSLLGPFQAQDGEQAIRAIALETLEGGKLTSENVVNGANGINGHAPVVVSQVAAVMLTSGSSGSAKAVPLTHAQMLAAFRGKTMMANLEYPKSPFLSWVHMDHVANLVHCHIFAIVSGVSQIHVPPAEILADPTTLLNLISRHQVSRTFAPNFLMAKLRRQLEAGKVQGLDAHLDLKTLYLDTGGEANVTEVCVSVQKLLSKYGAPRDLFKPSFGMTETCAGCIFNNNCPSYDDGQVSEFASLGKPMPGVRVRISRLESSSSPGDEADAGERGSLELKGDVIFKGYLNDEHANATSFTKDGWFVTGDLAYLDRHGNLHLDGRTKEMVNINGVKYLAHELDAALEQADIEGATPTYFCCFGTRAAGMDTEAVAVLYLPAFETDDDEARSQVQGSIIRVITMHTRSRPIVVPLGVEDMPKSTIGKLSRAKLKKAFETGEFAAHQECNDTAIQNHRQKTRGEPASDEERQILHMIREQLELAPENDFAVNDAVLSMGATSMDLVAIMQKVNLKLHLVANPLKLTDMLNYSTARQLANRIRVTALQDKHEYDAVVTLQPHGNKTPLFLVHPGVGEVLVFVNLSHHITDRPIYAFRAKGFNASEGETPFQSLDQVFSTYKDAIRARQPHGPYAIAGYSFGGMVAFEIAKRLESEGEQVKYCGSWNLPPHIKFRMRELLWDECVIHLFYFVGLFTEEQAYTHKETLCEYEKQGRRLEAIQYLHKHADQARWEELGLSEEYYLLWVGLASNMQGMAVDYDPSGSVEQMDVFVADPLSHVAKNREDWINNRLAAWNDFVRSDVKFHHVKGAHYTMLNPEYVVSFAETLRRVLRERGL